MKTCTIFSEDVRFSPVYTADTFFTRLRGLMFRKDLGFSEGLLLKNCSSVHCMFMRFTIDVIYLKEDFSVIAVETLKPWRVGGIYRKVRHVLEVGEGMAKTLKPGMKLQFEENDS